MLLFVALFLEHNHISLKPRADLLLLARLDIMLIVISLTDRTFAYLFSSPSRQTIHFGTLFRKGFYLERSHWALHEP